MLILYFFLGTNVLLAGYYLLIVASGKLSAPLALRYFVKCFCLSGVIALAAGLVTSFVV